MLADKEFTKKKQHKKRLRFVLEVVVCAAIGYLLVMLFNTFTVYSPSQEKTSDKGFIALSYLLPIYLKRSLFFNI
jgi:uncharacterized protein YsxB (DUF464 family)